MSAAGSANGSSPARVRGFTCPCGETIGRRRVSSYSARATRRTAGSGSKKRSASRTATPVLYRGRPARRVLPLPQSHRVLVAQDAPGFGFGAQRASRALGDIAEVAEQDALRTFVDRLVQGGACADRVHEVADVLPCHLVVTAGVEAEMTGDRKSTRL